MCIYNLLIESRLEFVMHDMPFFNHESNKANYASLRVYIKNHKSSDL